MKSASGILPTLFFLKIVWASLNPLKSPINFRMTFPISAKKNHHQDFDMNCTESVYHFGKYRHLSTIESSNPRTQCIFPFTLVFSHFFQQFLQSSVYKICTSLVKSVHMCFVLLDAIVNRVVNFLFRLFIARYRITTDFCVLILYT